MDDRRTRNAPTAWNRTRDRGVGPQRLTSEPGIAARAPDVRATNPEARHGLPMAATRTRNRSTSKHKRPRTPCVPKRPIAYGGDPFAVARNPNSSRTHGQLHNIQTMADYAARCPQRPASAVPQTAVYGTRTPPLAGPSPAAHATRRSQALRPQPAVCSTRNQSPAGSPRAAAQPTAHRAQRRPPATPAAPAARRPCAERSRVSSRASAPAAGSRPAPPRRARCGTRRTP